MNRSRHQDKGMLRVLTVALLVCALCATMLLTACASTSEADRQSSDTKAGDESATQPVTVNVASLKGPTSIGLVAFMEAAEQQDQGLHNEYSFTISGTADEIVPQLSTGDLDIALIPANLAATLYNKTEGEILALNINTLGVLYVVSGDDSITGMESLAGKTVLMTGKGTTPDYVFNYLLDQNGLSDAVTLEFKSEATEVAAALAADPRAVAVLPEPFVTSVTAKNAGITPRISLTEAWAESAAQSDEGSQLVTGVTVVRKDFAEKHPEVVQEFLEQQALSVEAAQADPSACAQLVVKRGIMDNAAAAEQAIPRCNLVCISGEEMETALSGYLRVLFDSDPASVGGNVPEARFYYL